MLFRSQAITTGINATIFGHLGMQPTIYNVFKLLCNDVDEFFRIVRAASIKAEGDYAIDKYKQIIANYIKPNNSDYIDTIFPFPLVVESQPTNGVVSQVRIAPIDLNKMLTSAGNEMPEMRLVYDFIDSFVKQRKINQISAIMEQKLQDGSNVWIPITPLDSEIATKSKESPYINMSNADAVYDVLLNRFYTLSQFSIPTKFYQKSYYSWWRPDNLSIISNAYIDMYAKSEAMNILVSQGSEKIIAALRIDSTNYYMNPDAFYTHLGSTKEIQNYKFTQGSRASISGAYLDRNNIAFSGVSLWFGDITELTGSEDTPLGIFAKDVQRGEVSKFFWGVLPESSFKFTSQNLLYIKDSYSEDGSQVVYDKIPLSSRFMTNAKTIDDLGIGTDAQKLAYAAYLLSNTTLYNTSYEVAIDHLIKTGNYGF